MPADLLPAGRLLTTWLQLRLRVLARQPSRGHEGGMDSELQILSLQQLWPAILGQSLVLSLFCVTGDWSVFRLLASGERKVLWASLIITLPWSIFVCAGFEIAQSPMAAMSTVLFGGWPLA